MLPAAGFGPAMPTTDAASIAKPATTWYFVRMRFLLKIWNWLWLNSGASVGVLYPFSLDDGLALGRAQPQRQFGTRIVVLKGAKVVHQVPRIFRLNHVRERGHRGAIQSGHKDLVQVGIRLAALGAIVGSEVVGPDGLVVAVSKCGGGRSVTAAL